MKKSIGYRTHILKLSRTANIKEYLVHYCFADALLVQQCIKFIRQSNGGLWIGEFNLAHKGIEREKDRESASELQVFAKLRFTARHCLSEADATEKVSFATPWTIDLQVGRLRR